jgi:hypothetical protein
MQSMLLAQLIALGLEVRPVIAQREISAAEYHDRLRGMWFGQLIANNTGKPFEGYYTGREAAPDSAFDWIIQTSYEEPWFGDDDTNFEYLYLHCLETYGLNPTCTQIQSEWDAHVPLSGIWIANRQAKYLMNHGFPIPDTGSYAYNMHAYAIDSQITTEAFGALSPGQRQWAIDAVRTFGGVTNEGFSLHAAQFYGAMYAAAAFEAEIDDIVALGQAAVPESSRSWQAIQDVRDWYADDMLDGTPDWRETRRTIYDYYRGDYDYGRYRNWIESTVNLAITTMSLLYGQGDFEETVRIGVLSGFDADCNPATAGGLVGLMLGYDALPLELTGPATDYYMPLDRPGLPEYDTITGIAARLQTITEDVIVANGGTVADGIYTIPETDPVTPDPELWDPPGPTGLVATVLNAGGTVTTSASVEAHDPLDDRNNLDAIIDGILDVRHNGHLPYDTYDGDNTQTAGGDYYQLDFSTELLFRGLTFYEGDIRWNAINGDPRVNEPRGGYFTDLVVEVRTAGDWVAAANLLLSEPLDPYEYFQIIDLTFDPLHGNAIRIRGDAGGTAEYTSIVEIVVTGSRLGDFDEDGDVDLSDLAQLLGCYGLTGSAPYEDGDLDGDGDVDLSDLGALLAVYGTTCE